MELGRRLLGFEHGYVVRELGVERLGNPLGRRAAVGGEARNLSRGMNSRIGATGDSETVPAPEHGIERVPERSLDRALAGLPRPASEARTVVLERELEDHGASIMRGCRSGAREPVSQAWCRSGMVVLAVGVGALLCLVTVGGTKTGEGRAENPPPVLAYAGDSAGNLDVYVTTLGRSNARRLTSSPRDEFTPSWSPDGRRIVYRVNPPRSDEGDVWVMRADGSRKRNLTRSPAVADWSPSWSPDGSRIAYFSTAGGGGDIWTMRADGSGKRNVTRNGALNEYPTWSPDGRSLAFNSHRDGQFEIYASASDGSDQRNLTRNGAKDQWPAWSPDGKYIAFMSVRDGNEDVFVMDAGGSAVRNLTRTRTLYESHPTWLPDGRLSYSRHGESGPIELWTVRADGSNSRRLRTSVQPVFAFGWKPSR